MCGETQKLELTPHKARGEPGPSENKSLLTTSRCGCTLQSSLQTQSERQLVQGVVVEVKGGLRNCPREKRTRELAAQYRVGYGTVAVGTTGGLGRGLKVGGGS